MTQASTQPTSPPEQNKAEKPVVGAYQTDAQKKAEADKAAAQNGNVKS